METLRWSRWRYQATLSTSAGEWLASSLVLLGASWVWNQWKHSYIVFKMCACITITYHLHMCIWIYIYRERERVGDMILMNHSFSWRCAICTVDFGLGYQTCLHGKWQTSACRGQAMCLGHKTDMVYCNFMVNTLGVPMAEAWWFHMAILGLNPEVGWLVFSHGREGRAGDPSGIYRFFRYFFKHRAV